MGRESSKRRTYDALDPFGPLPATGTLTSYDGIEGDKIGVGWQDSRVLICTHPHATAGMSPKVAIKVAAQLLLSADKVEQALVQADSDDVLHKEACDNGKQS